VSHGYNGKSMCDPQVLADTPLVWSSG